LPDTGKSWIDTVFKQKNDQKVAKKVTGREKRLKKATFSAKFPTGTPKIDPPLGGSWTKAHDLANLKPPGREPPRRGQLGGSTRGGYPPEVNEGGPKLREKGVKMGQNGSIRRSRFNKPINAGTRGPKGSKSTGGSYRGLNLIGQKYVNGGPSRQYKTIVPHKPP
jgi:hypothetical protein